MRLLHLDRTRVFLTLLVVAHHTSITYGGEGGWAYREGASDPFSPVVLSLFCGINQSFFMSAFFALAGYFCPSSLQRKGLASFTADRLVRLGVPLLVYNVTLAIGNDWLLAQLPSAPAFEPSLRYRLGPLWFLQALFAFSIVYALIAKLTGTDGVVEEGRRAPFMADRSLLGWIALLSVLTYLTRIWLPMGVWFVGIEPAHLVHYVFAFVAGIVAGRHGWFDSIPESLVGPWRRRCAYTAALLPIVGIALGALTNPGVTGMFMGGPGPVAAFYAVWETILMVGLTLVVLDHFQRRAAFDADGLLRPGDAYGAYIVHETVLIGVGVALAGVAVPTILKFPVVFAIVAVMSFQIARVLRRLPGAKRVLG